MCVCVCVCFTIFIAVTVYCNNISSFLFVDYYSHYLPISMECRMFAKGPETKVQSQVESHQRLQKCYLMPPCLALTIIKCRSSVSRVIQRKE